MVYYNTPPGSTVGKEPDKHDSELKREIRVSTEHHSVERFMTLTL